MSQKISINNKDKSKGLKLPKRITNDLAYLIGVFSGDGSLNYRPKKYEYSIKCVGNPKDEKEFYYKVISSKFKKVFGFKPKIRHFDKNTTFGFRIFSKSLVRYLVEVIGLPLGSKYKFLKIPPQILSNKEMSFQFIKGLFDTDGCVSFKKKYKDYPYYPVISFCSKSDSFTKEVANFLKENEFKIVEIYNYKLIDDRIKKGFTTISRIDLNGKINFRLWLNKIGFLSPKHKNKINKYWEE